MKIPLMVSVVALIYVVGVAVYATDFTAYLGNNPPANIYDLARQSQLTAVQAAGTPEIIQSGQ